MGPTNRRPAREFDRRVRGDVQRPGALAAAPAAAIDATAAGPPLVDPVSPGDAVLSVSNTVQSAVAVGESVRQAVQSQEIPHVAIGEYLRPFVTGNGRELVDAIHDGDDGDLASIATEFLEYVAESAPVSSDAIATMTLTAALRPCDRAIIVETLRRVLDDDISTPLDDCALVASTTQLIEAGVDVSFDTVYRDFAPVPSLVQAAGRCNRSFESDQGRVVLWLLADEESRLPSDLIYRTETGGDRLSPARRAVRHAMDSEGGEIPEATMIQQVVKRYYEELHESDRRDQGDDELVEAFQAANGDRLRDASMIKDRTDEAVVLISEADADRLNTYLRNRVEGNYQMAKSAFGELKHITASAPAERLAEAASTTAYLDGLAISGSTIELDEFDIVDARRNGEYRLRDGGGLRRSGS